MILIEMNHLHLTILLLIEKKMREIINLKDPVHTEVWERKKAIDYYHKKMNLIKYNLINDIPENEQILCIGMVIGKIFVEVHI